MKTNLLVNQYENVALYNEYNKAFIYFELEIDKDKNKSYVVSVVSDTNIIDGFEINKETIENTQNQILSYNINDKNNKLYVAYCLEQNMQLISQNLTDNFKIKFVFTDTDNNEFFYGVHIFRNFIVYDYIYNSNGKTINDNSSFMVLRTNPKLSGNIKLVVSPDYGLYLDTFQVSPILSKKEVRKREISAFSSYAKDVYTYFSNIPKSDIFTMNDYDTYDISLPKTKLSDQYITTYNYGARMLNDELYSENFSILAPLWIERDLPDFFVVFRVDNPIDIDSNQNIYDKNRITEYMKKASVVKTWSLKETTPLGKYLHTHLNDVLESNGNVFISLDREISNSWSGIPINYGILSDISETTYEFDNIAKGDNTNEYIYTNINNYITNGFGRNGVVCANLLNLQFNFNDTTAEDYSINRYFGLYLTANQLLKFNYYNGDIINEDKRNVLSNIKTTYIDLKSHFQESIYGISNGNEIKRVNELDDLLHTSNDNMVSDNKTSVLCKKLDLKSFINIDLSDTIKSGEHFLVTYYKDNLPIIIECVATNNSILKTGECYSYVRNMDNHIIITFDVNDNMTIQESVYSLYNALDMASKNLDFKVYTNNNEISIFFEKLEYANATLSYITSEDYKIQESIFDVDIDLNINDFNTNNSINKITFFGYYKLDTNCASLTNFKDMGDYKMYGHRVKYNIPFINLIGSHAYTMLNSDNISISNSNVFDNNGKYTKFYNLNEIIKVNSSYFTGNVFKNPFSYDKCILTPCELKLHNNSLTIFNLLDTKFELYSINNIKDFDFTVYDNINDINFKSEYSYNRETDNELSKLVLKKGDKLELSTPNAFEVVYGSGTIFNPLYQENIIKYNINDENDEKVSFNTFCGPLIVTAISDTIIYSSQYSIDKTHTFIGYDENIKEENIENYIESKYRLKYGLTSPHVCKWVMQGSDCRSNKLGLKTSSYMFNNGKMSNFIPMGGSGYEFFKDEIIYPVNKSLNTSLRDANSYVYYDINDKFIFNEECKSLKELLLSTHANIDVFNKIIYHNFHDDYNTSKVSILSYNKFYNTLDTIFKGMKLSFKISDNIIDTKKLDGYNFSMILSNSGNTTSNKPFEVFINNKFNNVLLVWYTYALQINYTNRYSHFSECKNFMENNNKTLPFLNNLKSIPSNISEYGIYNYSPSLFNLNTSRSLYEIVKNYDTNVVSIDDIFFDNYDKYYYQDAKNIYSNKELFTFIFNGNYDNNYIEEKSRFEMINNFKSMNNTYGDNIINKSYIFNTPLNLYKDNVANIDIFKELIVNPNNFTIYVINNNDIVNTNNLLINNVMSVGIEEPKLYNDSIYTHSGWYKPLFKNILEYYNNIDSAINNIFELDLTHSNTKIKNINNISQMWFHKVSKDISENDVEVGLAIDFRVDFSPLMNQWDDNYYTIYNGDDKVYLQGYNNPKEETSMLGSKLIKLPKNVLLDTWDNSSLEVFNNTPSWYDDNIDGDKMLIRVNVTNALQKFFFNNKFIENWDKLTISNRDDIINSYISESLIPLYNKKMSDISINIYYTNTSDNDIHYTKPNNTLSISNVYSTNMKLEYDSYIYDIIVPKNELVTYYVEILIK